MIVQSMKVIEILCLNGELFEYKQSRNDIQLIMSNCQSVGIEEFNVLALDGLKFDNILIINENLFLIMEKKF